MNKISFFVIFFCLVMLGLGIYYGQNFLHSSKVKEFNQTQITSMQLTSSAFKHEQSIPSQYTCDGEDINPPLTVTEVPEEAESLVLIVSDPDAPNKTWIHWTMWNINPDQQKIEQDSVPQGVVEGQTDFGQSGYGGPCPPSGSHRYFFKIYVLDQELNLAPGVNKEQLEEAMTGHIIDKAILMGTYSR